MKYFLESRRIFSSLLCAGGGDQASEDSKAPEDSGFQSRALTCWQVEASWDRVVGGAAGVRQNMLETLGFRVHR